MAGRSLTGERLCMYVATALALKTAHEKKLSLLHYESHEHLKKVLGSQEVRIPNT